MSLQEALKLLRLELGMTQEDLAKKLDKAFITINRWENGKGFPSRANAKKILRIAQDCQASKDCVSYLNEVLMPDAKRSKSAAAYGFPDIDRDFLFQLADGSTNALYVIEAGTYHLLYANKTAEKFAVEYLSQNGSPTTERKLTEQEDKRCFHYFGNRHTPCEFCPLAHFNSKEFRDTVITIPKNGKTLLTHAKATKMKEREVYAIYLTDITEQNAERVALYELTNDIPTGVGIFNVHLDEHISSVFINQALRQMLGTEQQNASPTHDASPLRRMQPKDRGRLWTEIKRSIAEKRTIDLTIHLRLADGKFHPINLTGKPLKKDTEKFTFYCLFREAEQQ